MAKLVRITDEAHRTAKVAAAQASMRLDRWIEAAITEKAAQEQNQK